MDEISSIFYKKEYIMLPTGTLLLTNPQPAYSYNTDKINQLLSAKTHDDELKIKLNILSDFIKIYHHDCDNAVRPEPFGVFESKKEKQSLIRRKQLIDDFGLYLGNIYTNYHQNMLKYKKNIPVLSIKPFIIN